MEYTGIPIWGILILAFITPPIVYFLTVVATHAFFSVAEDKILIWAKLIKQKLEEHEQKQEK